MFFEHWWQGIIFGFFTTVAMMVIAHTFTVMWRKYEDVPGEHTANQCNANMHH